LVVEIPKDRVKKSRMPPELNQPGIIIEDVLCKAITDNCKEYIVEELGAKEDSFVCKALFDEYQKKYIPL